MVMLALAIGAAGSGASADRGIAWLLALQAMGYPTKVPQDYGAPRRAHAAGPEAPFRQAGPRGGFAAAAGYGDRTDQKSLHRARHDQYRDEPVPIDLSWLI